MSEDHKKKMEELGNNINKMWGIGHLAPLPIMETLKIDTQKVVVKEERSEFERSIYEACNLLAKTLIQKNRDYKDSYVKSVDKYGKVVPLIRLSDKFSRYENMVLNGEDGMEVVEEKKEDTLLDLAGYSILEYVRIKK